MRSVSVTAALYSLRRRPARCTTIASAYLHRLRGLNLAHDSGAGLAPTPGWQTMLAITPLVDN
ncbi:hypothetical protein [Musicola keenii]|uniref:hypothetical protein n=1 Tax=Musicola keenii TaxID=2884250 RepID=UPI00178261EA|nr:hypothetical protein [Musicola keenii]